MHHFKIIITPALIQIVQNRYVIMSMEVDLEKAYRIVQGFSDTLERETGVRPTVEVVDLRGEKEKTE